MNTLKEPQIGQIARIHRGKDSGTLAVIINVVDQRYVMIADGKKRKFDEPKKKNLIHLDLLPVVSQEVADSLAQTGHVTNSKLRFALNMYVSNVQQEAQEKGE